MKKEWAFKECISYMKVLCVSYCLCNFSVFKQSIKPNLRPPSVSPCLIFGSEFQCHLLKCTLSGNQQTDRCSPSPPLKLGHTDLFSLLSNLFLVTSLVCLTDLSISLCVVCLYSRSLSCSRSFTRASSSQDQTSEATSTPSATAGKRQDTQKERKMQQALLCPITRKGEKKDQCH